MNWEAIGAIGELVSAAAVVISLVYVAIQLKQNTSAVNRASEQASVHSRADATRFLASDPEISRLLWVGAETPEELTQDQWQRFILLIGQGVRPGELAYSDYLEGRISDEAWEAQRKTLEYWLAKPGYQRWMGEYGHSVNPKFYALMEEVVEGLNSESDV